jgi:GT2 family glycosyltransferase
MDPIVVIVLTLNQRERTLACLRSMIGNEDCSYQVLVWDNGSDDGTKEAIGEEFPQVMVHHHPNNLGVASGRNAAAKLAIETINPNYLVFLDNDMLVEPGFVKGLLQPLIVLENVGQTQAKLRFMDDRSRINDGCGAKINFFPGK